jgi:hypothetical protein
MSSTVSFVLYCAALPTSIERQLVILLINDELERILKETIAAYS